MFSVPRGGTETFTVEVRIAGALVDLAGARIYFTARLHDAIIMTKANAAGTGGDAQIEVTELGKFKLKITSADTEREPAIAVCDCFVILSTGDRIQPVKNVPFQITQSQTRAFPVP